MVLLAASRILADLMKRFGQAAVIGELLAGVILGPTLLGRFAPLAYNLLFPPDPLAAHLLEAFAWAGAIMLFVRTGSETLSAFGLNAWWGPFLPAVLVILFFRWLGREEKPEKKP